jgi:hypothetical protein
MSETAKVGSGKQPPNRAAVKDGVALLPGGGLGKTTPRPLSRHHMSNAVTPFIFLFAILFCCTLFCNRRV